MSVLHTDRIACGLLSVRARVSHKEQKSHKTCDLCHIHLEIILKYWLYLELEGGTIFYPKLLSEFTQVIAQVAQFWKMPISTFLHHTNSYILNVPQHCRWSNFELGPPVAIFYALHTVFIHVNDPPPINNYPSSPIGLLVNSPSFGLMGYWLRGHEGERNNCLVKSN